MTAEQIPIFFSANVGYFQHLCVLLTSILENNQKHFFSFYVLADDENSNENEKIIQLKERYENFDVRFIKIDVPIIDSLRCLHVPVQGYYRYVIPDIVQELDKALYLDCDIVVDGDLSELWSTDIEDYYVVGVEDLYVNKMGFKEILGLDKSDLYINSGVMLMNLKAMRQDHVIDLLIANTKKIENVMKFPDQDAINITMKGKIKPLDKRFNWTTEYSNDFYKISKIHFYTVISHFTGGIKPWTVGYICEHKDKEKYFYYLQKTPYKNFIVYYRVKHFLLCSLIPIRYLLKLCLPIFLQNIIRQRKKKK
jgi:lipopolysaccharide biosynthesis glycosyltransferase